MVSAESPAVGAVVILDRDGVRIAGSYFDDQFRTLAQQQVPRRSQPSCPHARVPRPQGPELPGHGRRVQPVLSGQGSARASPAGSV
jgi:hypothetical protein